MPPDPPLARSFVRAARRRRPTGRFVAPFPPLLRPVVLSRPLARLAARRGVPRSRRRSRRPLADAQHRAGRPRCAPRVRRPRVGCASTDGPAGAPASQSPPAARRGPAAAGAVVPPIAGASARPSSRSAPGVRGQASVELVVLLPCIVVVLAVALPGAARGPGGLGGARRGPRGRARPRVRRTTPRPPPAPTCAPASSAACASRRSAEGDVRVSVRIPPVLPSVSLAASPPPPTSGRRHDPGPPHDASAACVRRAGSLVAARTGVGRAPRPAAAGRADRARRS